MFKPNAVNSRCLFSSAVKDEMIIEKECFFFYNSVFFKVSVFCIISLSLINDHKKIKVFGRSI